MHLTPPRLASGALALALALLGHSAFAESRYAKVRNGIGNILIGEVLPYGDDEGYKHPVLDSVKLSEFAQWESLYIRAFLGKKLGEIPHDLRVVVFHMTPQGKKVEQFRREVGNVLLLPNGRKGESSEYTERTEWARAFPGFNTVIPFIPFNPKSVKLPSWRGTYDPKNPDSFQYRELERDFGDDVAFNAKTMKGWKAKYGLTSITFDVKLFTFVDGGKVTTGTNKKVLVAKDDGTLEEQEKLASVATFTSWDSRQLVAQGSFTMILD